MNEQDRQALLLEGLKRVWLGEWTEGQLLQYLRKEVLGMTQEAYGQLVGVSRRSLSDIENGKAQANTKVLSQLFKPLGLKVGLLPRTPTDLKLLAKSLEF